MSLIISIMATAATAATVLKPDLNRTIYVVGEIGSRGAINTAMQIERLSNDGKPITLIINSPGGSITAGVQIISALKVAKARGNEIRCVVPVLAASMGFQIFINCDVRYTLSGSLLLFHPATSGVDGNKDEMLYASERLKAIEEPLIKDLFRVLRMPKDVFIYHYKNQTMWIAPEMKALCPHLFTIVDDVAAPDLFNLNKGA
jgi:ATP-dependent Clp protease protease subunit